MTRQDFLMIAATAAGATTMNAAEKHVYELRIYTTLPGRLPNLLKRFREHTIALFEKHGMKNIGYWVPQDEPKKSNMLYYMLAHKSRDAAKQSFDTFRADPAWVKARDASEADGKIVEKVESIFMDPTDFSKLS
jgi:hypothetical protein